MLSLFLKSAYCSQRLMSEWRMAKSQWAPKKYDPILLLSSNKSGPFSVCARRLSCQPVVVQIARRWAVWRIAYSQRRLDQWRRMDWLAQRGCRGKHFLCVLMDIPAEALWLLVADWWLLPSLLLWLSSPPYSFSITLPGLLMRQAGRLSRTFLTLYQSFNTYL